MKPLKFKVGQSITPNTKNWSCIFGAKPPVFGEIYKVTGYDFDGNPCPCGCGKRFVLLEGFNCDGGWNEAKFDLVVLTSEQVAALVEESLTQPQERA